MQNLDMALGLNHWVKLSMGEVIIGKNIYVESKTKFNVDKNDLGCLCRMTNECRHFFQFC
jgi:hypothetical protein